MSIRQAQKTSSLAQMQWKQDQIYTTKRHQMRDEAKNASNTLKQVSSKYYMYCGMLPVSWNALMYPALCDNTCVQSSPVTLRGGLCYASCTWSLSDCISDHLFKCLQYLSGEVAPVAECLRPLIFNALNCTSSHRCGFEPSSGHMWD